MPQWQWQRRVEMLPLRGVLLLLQQGNSLSHITHWALGLHQCQLVPHPPQIEVLLLSYSQHQPHEFKYHNLLTMCS